MFCIQACLSGPSIMLERLDWFQELLGACPGQSVMQLITQQLSFKLNKPLCQSSKAVSIFGTNCTYVHYLTNAWRQQYQETALETVVSLIVLLFCKQNFVNFNDLSIELLKRVFYQNKKPRYELDTAHCRWTCNSLSLGKTNCILFTWRKVPQQHYYHYSVLTSVNTWFKLQSAIRRQVDDQAQSSDGKLVISVGKVGEHAGPHNTLMPFLVWFLDYCIFTSLLSSQSWVKVY